MTRAWKPTIRKGEEPLYERLLEAIQRDIGEGVLSAGTKLPTHRELAHQLGVAVGTVTKTYAEAERRGLLSGHVGRGSFVAGGDSRRAFRLAYAAPEGVIDLARNYPPREPAERRFPETISRLRRRRDLLEVLSYAPPEGQLAHRRATADWLRRRHGTESIHADDLVLCAGGQQGLALAFAVLARPGDVVLCEAATFHGARALADHRSYRLHAVALDEQGILPDALERAVAATGSRVLYTIPTLQNPTGSIMSLGRRREIIEVARKCNLTIVEDDVYSIHADSRTKPSTLRDLAPDRVWYVGSVSKSLAPGLRAGFVAPARNPDAREQTLHAARADYYAPAGLGSLVVTQWIEDGAADEIADAVISEMAHRHALAAAILPAASSRLVTRGLHLWLPMSELEAERVAGRALRAGVEVTPPSAQIVAPSLVHGVRLCLGAPSDSAQLERALRIVAAALASDMEQASRAVV